MTLEIITHPDLDPIRHGFFTRKGGASSGVFSGLNCGRGSSDQDEAVAMNRARVAMAMGVGADNLIGPHQIHSAEVVTVRDVYDDLARADAMVTDRPGIALSVLTADCQPVLFADADAGVIGAAHAGWRGTMAGVLEATLDAMVALGADPERIVAVIGPTISQDAYEVGPDLHETVTRAHPMAARLFRPGDGDRLHFDLPGYGIMRLRAAGVGSVSWTGHCTYADADRFYSYRRACHRKDADYGRLIAAIRL